MALTREFFDGATCQHEDHDPETCAGGELYLHANCHPGSPPWLMYREGRVIVVCRECERLVTEIEVAPGPPADGGVRVELPRAEAEALAFPITQPTAETAADAEAAREKIRTRLYERYRDADG